MKVTFKTTTFEACYEQQVKAVRKWGAKVAKSYVARVNVLHQVRNAAELSEFKHLRFHALKGAMKGLHAVDLTERSRLILKFQDQELTVVQVEDVSKHYGD